MLQFFGYILAILVELVFAASFTVYTLFLIYSNLKGSPYVPTRMKEVRLILEQLPLSTKTFLLELGCGDGRVLREAAKRYGVKGKGIDVNPLLLFKANLFVKWSGLRSISFEKADMRKVSFPKADIVYLFLMPKLLSQLNPKLKKELAPGTIVVSHGFKIPGFESSTYKTLRRRPFPTYFYRIP